MKPNLVIKLLTNRLLSPSTPPLSKKLVPCTLISNENIKINVARELRIYNIVMFNSSIMFFFIFSRVDFVIASFNLIFCSTMQFVLFSSHSSHETFTLAINTFDYKAGVLWDRQSHKDKGFMKRHHLDRY